MELALAAPEPAPEPEFEEPGAEPAPAVEPEEELVPEPVLEPEVEPVFEPEFVPPIVPLEFSFGLDGLAGLTPGKAPAPHPPTVIVNANRTNPHHRCIAPPICLYRQKRGTVYVGPRPAP